MRADACVGFMAEDLFVIEGFFLGKDAFEYSMAKDAIKAASSWSFLCGIIVEQMFVKRRCSL